MNRLLRLSFVASLFLYVLGNKVFAQTNLFPSPKNPPLLSVQTQSSGSVNVCADSIVFTLTIKNKTLSDSTASNIYIQVKMKPGLEYEASSTLGASYVTLIPSIEYGNPYRQSKPNEPIFKLPSSLASQASIVITFKVRAACRVIPELQGISGTQPVGVFNTTDVLYNMTAQRFYNSENYGSESYNVNYAALQTLLDPTEKNKVAVKGDQLIRTVKVSNTGLGYIKDLSEGGNGLTLKIRYPSGLAFTKITLQGSAVALPYTLSADTVIVQVRDFSSVGDLNHRLDLGETVVLNESFTVNTCNASLATDYKALWGCNALVCNNADNNARNTAFVNVPTGNPLIVATALQAPQTNLCTNVAPVILYTNQGIGTTPTRADGAYDFTLIASTSGGEINNPALLDGAGNYITLVSLGAAPSSVMSLNNLPGLAADIDGAGQGLDDLDKDGFYDDLPAGKSITIRYDNNYTCPGNSYNRQLILYASCRTSCNGYAESNQLKYAARLSGGTSAIQGPTDVQDKDQVYFTLSTSSDRSLPSGYAALENCTTNQFNSTISIPNGYTVNSVLWNGSAQSYTQLGNSLTVNGGGFSGAYTLGMILDCGAAVVDPIGTVNWQMYYQCGPCNTCSQQIASATYSFFNHCLNCPGYHTQSFTLERTSLGKVKPATGFYTFATYQAAPKVSPSTPGLKLDRAYQFDTLQAIAKGILTAGSYDNAHVKVSYNYALQSSNPLTLLNGYYAVINNGAPCLLPAPLYSQSGTSYTYDFNIPLSCRGGVNFAAGDKIDIYFSYSVNSTASLGRGSFPIINFRAEHYGFDASNVRNACESFGASFNIMKPQISTLSSINEDNCGAYSDNWTLIMKRAPVSGVDPFPNEFRPLTFVTSATSDLPLGYTYVPNSAAGLSGYFAFPRIPEPSLTTLGDGRIRMSFNLTNDYIINDLYNDQFLADGIHYTLKPSCDTAHLPVSPNFVSQVNYSYNNNMYTYNPGLYSPTPAIANGFVYPQSRRVPNLKFAVDALQEGYSKVVTWPVYVSNLQDNRSLADSRFTFLKFAPNANNINLISAKDELGNTIPIIDAPGAVANSGHKLILLNIISLNSRKVIYLSATYTTCADNKTDSIALSGGWNCDGYPVTATDACKTIYNSKLYIRYKRSDLQASIVRNASAYNLCTAVPFQVDLVAAGFADVQDVKFYLQTPSGVTLDGTSGSYAFPRTLTNFQPIGTNASSQGTGQGWNLSQSLPLQMNPFNGSHDPTKNSIRLQFNVSADCDYDYGTFGEPLRFFAVGKTNCNTDILLPFRQYRLKIQGVDLDSLELTLDGPPMTSCGVGVPYTITAVNKGNKPSHTGTWQVTLPVGTAYVPSSGSPAPTTTVTNGNGTTTLTWPMAGGIAPNAQTQFTFYAAATGFGKLGPLNMIAKVQIPSSARCVTENRICTRKVTTGLDTLPLFISIPRPGLVIRSTDDSLCIGNAEVFTLQSTLPLTGYLYTWLVDGQVKQQGAQDNFTYSVTAGLHTITVQGLANGTCSVSATKTIKGLDVPLVIAVDGVTATTCVGNADGKVVYHLLPSSVAIKTIQLVGPGIASGIVLAKTQTQVGNLQAGDFQFVVTYANGCIRNFNFTIPRGGPQVTLCAANIGCKANTTYSSSLNFTATRVYPQATGTYRYQILKGTLILTTGNGVFGVAQQRPLTLALAGDAYTVVLIPDTNPQGNRCSVRSNVAVISPPAVSLEGKDSLRICKKGGTTPYSVIASAGQNACSNRTGSFTFQLYKYDSTLAVYVVKGAAVTQSTTTYNYTSLPVGAYQVKVTFDKNGYYDCSAIKNFVIRPAYTSFSVSLQTENIRCHGANDGKGYADVFAGAPPITYKWYADGSTNQVLSNSASVTGLAAGITYNLEVTDANSCVDSSVLFRFTLTEPPALAPVTLSPLDGCRLKATMPSGGTPGYSFTWTHYQLQELRTLDPLTDQITVTTAWTPQTLWVDTQPIFSGGVYTSDPTQYNNFIFSKGPYKVLVKDANGCMVSDSVLIQPTRVARTYELCMRYRTTPYVVSKPVTSLQGSVNDFDPVTLNNVIAQQVEDCKGSIAQKATMNFDANCKNVENLKDAMNITYNIHYQHYTLYYYDRAGRLARTVPPNGVHPIYTDRSPQALKHTYVSSYNYNPYGQLASQVTPDAGQTNFIYNEIGQLRFSQNARQQLENTYSYSKYDSLGRVIEVGESKLTTTFKALSAQLTAENAKAVSQRYPLTTSALNSEQTFTQYSEVTAGISYYNQQGQQYLQNRVSHVYTINKNKQRSDLYYSYDPHGNVRWLVSDIPNLGKNYVKYQYDLISNKVLKVKYNEYRSDRFFNRYSYDEDNRITKAETSKDSIIWDKDARYSYYAHGPLRRAGLGEDKIQGMDYTYTIQGWLKGINAPGLIAKEDPGRDSLVNKQGYSSDVFGMALGYYQGDFTRATALNSNPTGKYFLSNSNKNLYNGNISTWASKINDNGQSATSPYGNKLTGESYSYDRLNRIKKSNFSSFTGTAFASTSDYGTSYSYDGNGNILTLTRRAQNNILMDDLKYLYYGTETNKLAQVLDNSTSPANGTLNDLASGQTATNYVYDASGRLIRDEQAKLTFVWTVSDKLSIVIPDKTATNQAPSLKFTYDPMGNRIAKEVNKAPTYVNNVFKDTLSDLSQVTTTLYVRDASGNVLSIYERSSAFLKDTTYSPCANDPIDVAINNGTKYCYAKAIPSFTTKQTGYRELSAALNTINNGDTLIISQGSTYAQNFTLNAGGVLIVQGSYTPSYYTFNGGTIITTPQGTMTFPYINLGASQRIDNYGSLTMTNASVSGKINNYGTIKTIGSLALNTSSNTLNYGTLNATGGLSVNSGTLTNEGSINVTGDLVNNKGTILSEGPITISNNLVNNGNGGSFKNRCTIAINNNFELNAPFYNLGKITAANTSTLNGAGKLFLEGGASLITSKLTQYNVIQNDSTACSLLKVSGTVTKGGGAGTVGNVNICTPTTAICPCVPGKPICNPITKKLYLATFKQIEVPIYGSDRLGDYKPTGILATVKFTLDTAVKAVVPNVYKAPISRERTLNRLLKLKHYELKDHLGNVRVLVSDARQPIFNGASALIDVKAKVEAYYNYYAFGMLMPGRVLNPGDSRYGQNTQEKIDEISSGHYTAMYWEYDSRIGRRWNIDPKPNPSISGYSCFSNNPIWYTDYLGDTLNFSHLLSHDVVSAFFLLHDLEKKTGLSLYLDAAGNVRVNAGPTYKNGKPDGSKTARNTLIGIINHNDVLNVNYSASKSGTHVPWRGGKPTNNINIVPHMEDQDMASTSKDIHHTTFVYALAFFHEFKHTTMGGGTEDPNGLHLQLGGKGNQVRFENKIRRELGTEIYGKRVSYRGWTADDGHYYQPFSGKGKLGLMFFKTPPKSKYVKY